MKTQFTVTALDLTKTAHNLGAYVFISCATEKEARARVARLLHVGTFSQISVKQTEPETAGI